MLRRFVIINPLYVVNVYTRIIIEVLFVKVAVTGVCDIPVNSTGPCVTTPGSCGNTECKSKVSLNLGK